MIRFHRGCHAFHPLPEINYQLNRWLPMADPEAFARIAPRIGDFADWKREMLALADDAGATELHRATYLRAAEFFMPHDDPDKLPVYLRYRDTFRRAVADEPCEWHAVPYAGASLPVICFPARGARRDTLLLHGGFDSYMEEFFFWGREFAERGIEVLLFEGPGQGAARRLGGLPMAHDWDRPVRAVLDHFGVGSCTLFGLSLGGCLGPRAAAAEPRIRRLVAVNVLADFFACFTSRLAPATAAAITELADADRPDELDAAIRSAAAAHPGLAWALSHGAWISGSRRPAEFIRWLRAMTTRDVSAAVRADVLLTAGTADHIVPQSQLTEQIEWLTGARSVTARVFTAAEQAAEHCQIDNVRLMLDEVQQWHERALQWSTDFGEG
jgi:pimeloyl-ACP methyl ester carboxylesterase